MNIIKLFISAHFILSSHTLKAYDTPPMRGTYPYPKAAPDFDDDLKYERAKEELAKNRQRRKLFDTYDTLPTRVPFTANRYHEAEDIYQPKSPCQPPYQQPPSYQTDTTSQYRPIPNYTSRHRDANFDRYDANNDIDEAKTSMAAQDRAQKKIQSSPNSNDLYDESYPQTEHHPTKLRKRKRTSPQPVEDEKIIEQTTNAASAAQEPKEGFIDKVTKKAESLDTDSLLKAADTANKLFSMFGKIGG